MKTNETNKGGETREVEIVTRLRVKVPARIVEYYAQFHGTAEADGARAALQHFAAGELVECFPRLPIVQRRMDVFSVHVPGVGTFEP